MADKEKVLFSRGPRATMPSSKVPGTIYITTDTGEMFVDDTDTSRIQVGPSPADVRSLGLTGATVGQTVKIKAVDENGIPTEWEAADGDGDSKPFVVTVTYGADTLTADKTHAEIIEAYASGAQINAKIVNYPGVNAPCILPLYVNNSDLAFIFSGSGVLNGRAMAMTAIDTNGSWSVELTDIAKLTDIPTGAFIVNLTMVDISNITADKTFAEIKAASDDGKVVVAKFADAIVPLCSITDSDAIFEITQANSAAVVTVRFTCASDNVWRMSQNGFNARALGISGASVGQVPVVKSVDGDGKPTEWEPADKMDKSNPTGTGSFSLNRKSGTIVGVNSHAEGNSTTASGSSSHAEGYFTTASGEDSHAEGGGTKAASQYQHAQGKYNIEDSGDTYADIIGNGASDASRSNAATVDWSGNAWYAGDVYVGSISGTNKDAGSKKLATEEYVDSAVSSYTGEEEEIFCETTTEKLASFVRNTDSAGNEFSLKRWRVLISLPGNGHTAGAGSWSYLKLPVPGLGSALTLRAYTESLDETGSAVIWEGDQEAGVGMISYQTSDSNNETAYVTRTYAPSAPLTAVRINGDGHDRPIPVGVKITLKGVRA